MSRLWRRLLCGLVCCGLLIVIIGEVRVSRQRVEDSSYELTVKGSKGGELVISYGSESYTVDSESSTVILIPECVEVKVSAIPADGYIAREIRVSDMDGNTVDCVEDMGSVSFEMSDGRLVEGSFIRTEEGTGTEEENLGSTFAE